VPGGVSSIATFGGVPGGVSRAAKAELATAQEATKAIRLIFITCSNVESEKDAQNARFRRKSDVRARFPSWKRVICG
jgi:hypothetical protein